MIYHGCIAGGCSVEEATIIYLGVRIGALASSVPQWTPAIATAHTGPRLAATATENKLQDDFGRAAEMVLDRGEVELEPLLVHPVTGETVLALLQRLGARPLVKHGSRLWN